MCFWEVKAILKSKSNRLVKDLRRGWPALLLAAILSALLLGCGRPPTPAPMLPGDARRTATPTSAPAATATPPPATPDPCPPRQVVARPTPPPAFDDYVATLREYLAAGGDPTAIPGILAEWGARPAESGRALVQTDLTGDQSAETIVAMIDPQAQVIPPPGVLAIYTCRAGEVQTLYTYHPGPNYGLSLIGAGDLTGDGVAEVVFTEVSCGAHTCWHIPHVWSWAGQDFQERVEGDLAYPAPTFSLAEGQLLARSAGIGSVGAGPQRPMTETLAWNGQAITVTGRTLGPARYRYHVYIEGDEDFFAENYDHAALAYRRVIEDETLQTWGGFYGEQEERHWLTAAAHWRLLLIETLDEDYAAAEAHLDHLQEIYPTGTPGHEFAALAQMFWDAFLETGNIAYGCQDVTNAPAAQTVLQFFNSFGYANPVYNTTDLCPFLSP